jgi:NADH:quinone reductase (non-electrogenic)
MSAAPRAGTLPVMRTHAIHRLARGGTLVIGGGFAGANVARGLGRKGATIVNPSNFMLYTPLLPEAAAGRVEPRHVTVPLRTMCPHADLLLGSVVDLDIAHRHARVRTEAGTIDVAYQDVVIALGSVTRMPDVPGLAEHAHQLKDLGDAIRLRNHVLRQIELADAAPHSAERRLTFVFAGAGYAGVETIAELQELAAGELRRHRRLRDMQARWVLVDAGPRILGQTPEGLARFAARTLERRGIEIVSGSTLAGVDRRGAVLGDGTRISAGTVVWTAGVAANPLAKRLGLPVDERGRVRVDETMRVEGTKHVWSLGDCAAVPNAAHDGELDPPTCQHALRQARLLARNVRGRHPQPYRYRTRGQMATLGSRHGIAVLGKVRVRGLAGWVVARGYHLMALPFASRRIRVLGDWFSAALFRRDVAELTLPEAA